MPRFSRAVELIDFEGYQIPRSSTMACAEIKPNKGCYFFWRGAWNFTVFNGTYITPENMKIENHVKNERIVRFK